MAADFGQIERPCYAASIPVVTSGGSYHSLLSVHSSYNALLSTFASGNRSASAIEHKVVSIAKNYPYLKRQGGWDLDFVDRWIDDLLGDHELVNTLIQFSPEDAQDVALVRSSFKLL